MVAPYTQATQNNNKCPHGFPIGACPICSGMSGSGASRDKDKPRKAGEMSYNECMAAWIKIQAAKEAKIQARIDRLENAQALKLQNNIMLMANKAQKFLDQMMQKINAMPSLIKTPVLIIAKVIIAPILNLVAKIPQIISNVQAFFSEVSRFVASVSEKMAMVLGEVKNFIDSQFVQKTKKALKTLLSLFTESSEEDKENEEVEKLKLREMKKILKGMFRIRSKAKEEKEENENDPI